MTDQSLPLTLSAARRVLTGIFGYPDFRKGQAEIIESVLRGSDTLAIMPTGAGKSICYQVPALLFPGTTLVVSPLISLMDDQVSHLRARGIDAYAIHAGTGLPAGSGLPKILYVSPERLQMPSFLAYLGDAEISFLVVDEAHCVVSWGREFRPPYQKIPEFAGKLLLRPRIAAFTATADVSTRKGILRALDLRDPFVLVTGFDRPNLRYWIDAPEDKDRAIFDLLRTRPGECAIIYCMTRTTVMSVTEYLVRKGIYAVPYHAGLSDEVRARNQALFLTAPAGSAPVMIATNAFGMGVDKPDIRLVIHYNMPKDMESYYQEAGRAGRDGAPADCLLLFSPGDPRIGEFFIDREISPSPEEREKLRVMIRYAAGRECLRAAMLRAFGESAPDRCEACSFCLGQPPTADLLRNYEANDSADVASAGTVSAGTTLAGTDSTGTASAASCAGYAPTDAPAAFSRAEKIMTAGRHRFLPPATDLRSARARRIPDARNAFSREDRELYEKLLRVRADLAKSTKKSAEKIFPDHILRAMVFTLPVRKRDLLLLDGISPVHVFRFGEPFLTEIRLHIYFYFGEKISSGTRT